MNDFRDPTVINLLIVLFLASGSGCAAVAKTAVAAIGGAGDGLITNSENQQNQNCRVTRTYDPSQPYRVYCN